MMVGNGLVAQLLIHLAEDPRLVIYASGVSNSLLDDDAEFLREKEMLQHVLHQKMKDQHLVYFSTFNVMDPSLRENKYVKHKLEIESFLRRRTDTIIVRIPILIAASENNHTLINFLNRNIRQGLPFEAFRHATRYFISASDFQKILSADFLLQPRPNQTIHIAFPQPLTVPQLIEEMEMIAGNKAKYQLIDKGSSYVVEEIEYPLPAAENARTYVAQSLKEIICH